MVSRDRRLRRRADFESVRRRGRRVGDSLLTLTVAESEMDQTRWGMAVSRRVGGAVVRNRVKRLLRESIRLTPCREGHDVVIAARPRAADASLAEITTSLGALLERSGLSSENGDRNEGAGNGTVSSGDAPDLI